MADDIRYSYSHVPTIKQFTQSRKFIRGLMGPFGSGKSSGCAIELVKWGARQAVFNGKRRSRFAVIRNTYRQLQDTTIRTFMDWVPDRVFGTYTKTDHSFLVDKLDEGLEIEILFRALDRPEHVANLLSLELTGAWVNEAREIPFAVIKALQGRVGRFPKVMEGGCIDPGVIMDTNPPDDDSWWYELFEEKKPENVQIFKQPSGRSPQAENLVYLPKGYYENLVMGSDPDFVRVYVDGQYGYVRDGKPIYPEYNDSIHCSDVEPVPGVVIQRGWDFGLTPACVFTQIHPDGRWLIFDELVADDLGIDTFADAVNLHSAQKYSQFQFEDYGDPAGSQRSAMTADKAEKTCFDILQGKGIKIHPSEQNLTIRIESVKKPLNTLHRGRPQVQLHSRCKKLRKGFQGRYQYKRLKIAGTEERFHDMPDKNQYSHPHDGLQYVAVKVFGGAVRSRSEKPVQLRYEDVPA
jgi:hypothetical protein